MANPLSTLTDAAGGALVVPEFAAQPILDTIQNYPGVAALADVQTTSSQKDVFHVISDDSDAYFTSEGAPISEAGMDTSAVEISAKKLAVINRQTREMLEDTNSAAVLSALAENVRVKMAQKLDQHVLGLAGAATVESEFGSSIREDVTQTTDIASVTGVNVQDGISAAIEACENAGADPASLSVLLSRDLARVFRDQVEGSSSNRKLFRTAEEATFGLPFSYSQNLATSSGLVAVVGAFNNTKIRVRSDITVASADQGTVGGVSLFETDTLALRWTMRVAAAAALLPNKYCKVIID